MAQLVLANGMPPLHWLKRVDSGWIQIALYIRTVRVLADFAVEAETNGILLFHRWRSTLSLKMDTVEDYVSPYLKNDRTVRTSIELLRDKESLHQVACACLLIGGKTSDERRLVADLARCGLAANELREHTNSEKHVIQRRVRSRIRSDAARWASAIEKYEFEVLKDVGFMTLTICDQPQKYLVPLMKALIPDFDDRESGSTKRSLQRAFTLLNDVNVLPIAGVVCSAFDLCVMALETIFRERTGVDSIDFTPLLACPSDTLHEQLRTILRDLLQSKDL